MSFDEENPRPADMSDEEAMTLSQKEPVSWTDVSLCHVPEELSTSERVRIMNMIRGKTIHETVAILKRERVQLGTNPRLISFTGLPKT